jgi:hypothetical protein
MEGLKLRSFIVSGALLAFGAWVYLTPKPQPVPGQTEDWMETVAPAVVGDYTFRRSAEDPQCTYKAQKMVYDTLLPTVGIVARVYEHGSQGYDVNLIASRDRGSFHDPRVCFTAQKYDIKEEKEIEIPTKHRGKIRATFAKMKGPDGDTSAVYFYRGPKKQFYSNTSSLKIAMLLEQFKGKTDVDGVFYRFIPMGDNDPERLIQFIGLYMDTAAKDGQGYF